jgi:hypothetical protein
MPFAYDTDTHAILMACGDTANIRVKVQWYNLGAGDVLLFAVFDRDAKTDVLCKPVPIEQGWANVRLCNHDTRDIPPGRYRWNLRIVTDPVFDDDGKVRVDACTSDVVTVFDSAPIFRLVNGGGRV